MVQEFYAVDLPGKSLYSEEFSISIRRITPIEQKYIISLSQKEQKSNRDYIEFIKKLTKIDNPKVAFEDLYWFDIQYLLYKIRFTTYAKYPIKLGFKCREKDCDNEIAVNLNTEDLAIYTPEDLENYVSVLKLDNLGETKIRQKIIRDDISIDELSKKHNLDQKDIQIRLLLLDLCLISTDKSLDELYALAEDGTITASDILEIENWFKNTIWGVREEIKVKCPRCGKEETRGYYLSLEDFFSAV